MSNDKILDKLHELTELLKQEPRPSVKVRSAIQIATNLSHSLLSEKVDTKGPPPLWALTVPPRNAPQPTC